MHANDFAAGQWKLIELSKLNKNETKTTIGSRRLNWIYQMFTTQYYVYPTLEKVL